MENRVLICSIPYLVEQHGPEIACTSEAPGITVSSLDHDVTALSFSEGDSRLAVGSSAGRVRLQALDTSSLCLQKKGRESTGS